MTAPAGNDGYIMGKEPGTLMPTIEGVYVGELCATKNDDGGVYAGRKTDTGIDCPATMSMDEMNRFCLMWLLIFDPAVIVPDETLENIAE